MNLLPNANAARPVLLATIVALGYPLSAAAADDFPVYPAATTKALPHGNLSVTSRCGHTFTMEKSLTVAADPHTVARWYQSRFPGSRLIDLTRFEAEEEGGSSSMTSLEVFSADGSQTIVVDRMNVEPALASASKTLGLDKTQIGIESVSPPLPASYIALTAQAAAGGGAKSAKQQMAAACKS